MQKQLAVLPGIRPEDNAVTERGGTGGFGNDLGAARGFGQFFIVGQEDAMAETAKASAILEGIHAFA